MKKLNTIMAGASLAIVIPIAAGFIAGCGAENIGRIADISGISDATGIDAKDFEKEVTDKFEKGKEIIANSSEGISTIKETAEDINELASQASEFADKMAEDTGAKEKIQEYLEKLKEKSDTKETTDSTGSGNTDISESDKDIADGAGNEGSSSKKSENTGLLTGTKDINLTSTDGGEKNYTFVYDGVTYSAIHTVDHWTIIDSYKINNSADMRIICQALIDVFPVHGADMKSYRTAEDMTFEWQQHNIGYIILGENSEWASHLKDVDFDPGDQGKTIDEMYEDRTGKEFNLKDFLSN